MHVFFYSSKERMQHERNVGNFVAMSHVFLSVGEHVATCWSEVRVFIFFLALEVLHFILFPSNHQLDYLCSISNTSLVLRLCQQRRKKCINNAKPYFNQFI